MSFCPGISSFHSGCFLPYDDWFFWCYRWAAQKGNENKKQEGAVFLLVKERNNTSSSMRGKKGSRQGEQKREWGGKENDDNSTGNSVKRALSLENFDLLFVYIIYYILLSFYNFLGSLHYLTVLESLMVSSLSYVWFPIFSTDSLVL